MSLPLLRIQFYHGNMHQNNIGCFMSIGTWSWGLILPPACCVHLVSSWWMWLLMQTSGLGKVAQFLPKSQAVVYCGGTLTRLHFASWVSNNAVITAILRHSRVLKPCCPSGFPSAPGSLRIWTLFVTGFMVCPSYLPSLVLTLLSRIARLAKGKAVGASPRWSSEGSRFCCW